MSFVHGDAVLNSTEMFWNVPEQVYLYEGKMSAGEDNLIGCSHFSQMAQAPRLAKVGKLSNGLGYETCVFQLGCGKNTPYNL